MSGIVRPQKRPGSDSSDHKSISFDLRFPGLPKIPRISAKQLTVFAAIVLLALSALLAQRSGLQLPAFGSPNIAKVDAKPTFDTLAVNSEAAQKFDPQKGVASFNDEVGGITVIVSQQQLPDKLKSPSEVEKLAKGFNAKNVINVDGFKAYHGISSVDGSNIVVFSKKDLLVFIRSKKNLEMAPLTQYIKDLQ